MTASPPQPKARPRSRLGRGIVVGIFAAVVAWTLISVLGSMLVELYGGPPSPGAGPPTAAERSWCGRRLRALRDGLEARVLFEAGGRAARGTSPLDRWRAWSEAWERELEETASICRERVPESAEPFAALTALHASYTSGTESILEARRRHGQALDEAVDGLAVGGP